MVEGSFTNLVVVGSNPVAVTKLTLSSVIFLWVFGVCVCVFVCVCVLFIYTISIIIICVSQEEPSLIASNQ